MKLYVIPVEAACNASCKYCITKFRGFKDGLLDLADLKKVLNENKYEKIEITGGGEPTLHPRIDEIIALCTEHAPTKIYTNGSHFEASEAAKKLFRVCISRAHYDDDRNAKIMGVKYDLAKFKGLPIKFSLMIHRSGINSEEEMQKYLDWAKDFAGKVVIRQLFESVGDKYHEYYEREYVPTIGLFENSDFDIRRLDSGEREFDYKGVLVKIEEVSCACENDNPVLHADGKVGRWEEA